MPGGGWPDKANQKASLRHMKAAGLTSLRFALGLGLALFLGTAASGADAAARLALSASPLPEDGLYEAGDDLQFVIDHQGGQVRMRFIGSDEVFYLASEPAPLGGRVLKYDSGEVALQVAGWGGVTLYTDQARSGVPAERADASNPVDPIPVAAADLGMFASRLAQEVAVEDDLAIGFTANWDALADDGARALAVDAMRDATYAIAQLAHGTNHAALEDRLHIVKVVAGTHPAATFQGGVLTVTYAPQDGPSARPSSLVIRRALEAAL